MDSCTATACSHLHHTQQACRPRCAAAANANTKENQAATSLLPAFTALDACMLNTSHDQKCPSLQSSSCHDVLPPSRLVLGTNPPCCVNRSQIYSSSLARTPHSGTTAPHPPRKPCRRSAISHCLCVRPLPPSKANRHPQNKHAVSAALPINSHAHKLHVHTEREAVIYRRQHKPHGRSVTRPTVKQEAA